MALEIRGQRSRAGLWGGAHISGALTLFGPQEGSPQATTPGGSRWAPEQVQLRGATQEGRGLPGLRRPSESPFVTALGLQAIPRFRCTSGNFPNLVKTVTTPHPPPPSFQTFPPPLPVSPALPGPNFRFPLPQSRRQRPQGWPAWWWEPGALRAMPLPSRTPHEHIPAPSTRCLLSAPRLSQELRPLDPGPSLCQGPRGGTIRV